MNGLMQIFWSYLQTKYLRKFNSRQQLEKWQEKQVKQFLRQIIPQSKFYQTYYQGLDIANWRDFPTINKSIMMDNFDDLNTVGITQEQAFDIALKAEKSRYFAATLNGFTIGMSSGTSGNRGLFIVSQQEQQKWAGAILAKGLPTSIFKPQKIAFFLRANSNLYQTVKRQHIQFEYFDLFEPVERNLQRLNEYQPSILVAPPSMLRIIAMSQENQTLKIHPGKIISVAEVLDPIDNQYISQVFGQIIHQFYQCTEGFLGFTCEYGTLHLNEDILIIQKQYLDKEKGKFMPIITDFNRRSQPIIRYCLNDILTEAQQPCPCGSNLTAIASIEGRQDDIFYLPHISQEKLQPIFPDFIRRVIISASSEILEYQVIQVSLNMIEIELKLSGETNKAEIESSICQNMATLFTSQNCQIPQIVFKNYPPRTEHHQKLRRVRCHVQIN